MQTYLVITKTLFASFLRDKQTLFFTLIFPLVFLFIFGFLYGQGGDEGSVTRVAAFAEDEITSEDFWQILNNTAGLRPEKFDSPEEVKDLVRSIDADLGLIFRAGEVLEVYTNPARLQDNTYFQQVAQGVKTSLDQQRMGLVKLIRVEQLYQDAEQLPQISFLFPGIIALGVLSSGLFAISASFMHYKDKKVLKRLVATAMHKSHFLAALITTRMIASIISAFLIIAVGVLVFQVSLTINWALFIPYLLVSTIIMMGLGSLVTLIAKTAENASQISGILMVLMMFLSGIYFPVEFLPNYFQQVSVFLPLSYVARGFRFIMGMESIAISQFLIENLVLLCVSIGLIWFATVYVRWTED